jgi:GGDEF domain-containing protein
LISLAKYLRSGSGSNNEAASSYVRAISLLLHGLELHTLDYDKEECERFRFELAQLQNRVQAGIPIPELLVLVGEAIGTFEAYNRQTSSKLRAQFSELQSIIAAFSRALAAMVSASDASLTRLGEIRSQLGSAESIGDLRVLKTHLCDCLNGMASEVEEHKRNSAAGMDRLAKGARELENSMLRAKRTELDSVTGLPARAEAEATLARVATSGVPGVAAVFALKRLTQVSSRFGSQVSDGVLARLAAYLGSGAKPEEGLYRWSEPALLAVLTRNASFDRIRREIGGLVSDMPEYEVQNGGRNATIPIAVGWTAFPVAQPVDRLIRQLEMFVKSQIPEDSYAAK